MLQVSNHSRTKLRDIDDKTLALPFLRQDRDLKFSPRSRSLSSCMSLLQHTVPSACAEKGSIQGNMCRTCLEGRGRCQLIPVTFEQASSPEQASREGW